ncbi:hypothetical protein SDC9_131721 [bioreactor metagenome]|uniref:Uncharacterized protein n=1 Tax=bioreactor metagenome TaxID=1076179 RepID=A0A645D6F3_9ZZZZ
MGAETVLHSNFAVVEDDLIRNAAKPLKRLHEGIQEALFVLPSVSNYHWYAAVAQPGAEQIHRLFDAVYVYDRFAPVHLNGFSRREFQRYESSGQGFFQFAHLCAHGGFSTGKSALRHQTVVNSFRGMPLLSDALSLIFLQTFPYEAYCSLGQYRRAAFRRLAFPRHRRAVTVFCYCFSGNVQLSGNAALAFTA